jgi:hypothetical protein
VVGDIGDSMHEGRGCLKEIQNMNIDTFKREDSFLMKLTENTNC